MRLVDFARFGTAAALAIVLAPSAEAASIIKDPNPPKYKVEIEPHLNVQYFYADTFGGHGFGPGIRFSIPIMSPGFVKKINDSVAISFGGDFLYLRPYDRRYCDRNGCYDYGGKGWWGFYSPVALQWNFFLTRKWSVFAELGGIVHSDGFFARSVWIDPTVFLGGRFHFNDKVALTMRAGSPWVSVGVSFFVGG